MRHSYTFRQQRRRKLYSIGYKAVISQFADIPANPPCWWWSTAAKQSGNGLKSQLGPFGSRSGASSRCSFEKTVCWRCPRRRQPQPPRGTAGVTPAPEQTPPGCTGSSEDAWRPKRATCGQLGVCTTSQRLLLLKLLFLP